VARKVLPNLPGKIGRHSVHHFADAGKSPDNDKEQIDGKQGSGTGDPRQVVHAARDGVKRTNVEFRMTERILQKETKTTKEPMEIVSRGLRHCGSPDDTH
jgi:hypothetical protein